MIIACATDDKKELIPRHFGDANYYCIYKLTKKKFEFIKFINNKIEEENQLADPKKAKGIAGLLKKEKVDIAVCNAFGPNISRIAKHFLPIISDNQNIDSFLKKAVENYDLLNKLTKSNQLIAYNFNINQKQILNPR